MLTGKNSIDNRWLLGNWPGYGSADGRVRRSPGSVITPLHRQSGQTEAEFADYVARTGRQVPVGRMAEAEEIAEAVCFLASDHSRYMLGAAMVVDGGRAEL